MIRIPYIIILVGFISFHSFGQKPKLRSISWRDNWKLEIKTGAIAILTPVPDKYLERTNNVNVPIGIPGPIEIISVKKNINSHLEMGYQFDYSRIQGKAKGGNTDVEVNTQTYIHTYQIQYNFKNTRAFKPLFNYYLYYKIGGISLKNVPMDQSPQEMTLASSEPKDKFASNVAVLTGIGTGINYQLNNNFSLTGSLDLNKSSDAVDEIYKIHNLFFHSSHTVNKYVGLTFGLSYWFSLGTQKKSTYYRSRNETDKQLIRARIKKKKGQSSASNYPIWYNPGKGS